MPPARKRGRPPKVKKAECLNCSIKLEEPYQLIFDESGIELDLQKLLSVCFEMEVIKDKTQIQALCDDCLNKLIDVFDVMQKDKDDPGPSGKSSQTLKEDVKSESDEPQDDNDLYDVTEEPEVVNVKDSDLTEFEDDIQEEFEIISQSEDDDNETENVIYLEDFDEDFDVKQYKIDLLQGTHLHIVLPHSVQCRLCNEDFGKHVDVLNHTESAHCVEDFAYPCIFDETCEPQKNMAELSLHIIFNHYDLEKTNIYTQCPECDRRFSNFMVYNKHSCYLGGKISRSETQCEPCGKMFKSNKRYRFHMNFHEEKRRPKACFICDSLFRDEDEFFEHIMYQHDSNLGFFCMSCDKAFTTEQNLRNHESIHKVRRPYNCKLCNKSYLYNQLLKDHMLSAHGKSPFKCHICGKYLIKKTLLNRHILSHSTPQAAEITTCSICGLVFEKSEEATDHINEHDESEEPSVVTEVLDTAYCCEYCELAYNSIENLIVHREPHDKNRYFCDLCPLSYDQYKKLRTHKLTHINYVDKRNTFPIMRHYVCDFPDCTMSYLQWTSLKSHKRHKHSEQKRFQCQKCPEGFSEVQPFKKHMEDVHKSSAFRCQFCNKDFNTKMAVAVHIARRHNASRFHCDSCEQSYATKALLDKHKNNIHNNFTCKLCGKILKNLKNYQVHQRMVHDKEKRYFCKYCNKGYYNNCDKTEHESTVHEKIKKYQCDLCPYSAVYKECLVVHQRAHRNETPFKCELCNKEFRRSYALHVHMKRHYSIRDFVCPYEDCGASYTSQSNLNSHIKSRHEEGGTNEPKPKRTRLTTDSSQRLRYEGPSSTYFVDDDDGLDDGVIGEPNNQNLKDEIQIVSDENIEYVQCDSAVIVQKNESDHNYIVRVDDSKVFGNEIEEVFEVVMQDI